jgi:hypothetical protein
MVTAPQLLAKLEERTAHRAPGFVHEPDVLIGRSRFHWTGQFHIRAQQIGRHRTATGVNGNDVRRIPTRDCARDETERRDADRRTTDGDHRRASEH